ncbi:glycosyltransferase family 4 protein [Denitromonas iodatirespirans]|uniref:Glycosyltransferase family 4 protein n=1 Tax=Denitromonas iodatirespirans TaxID=2795389 RepID=A0A944H9I6_DENI1|nr:glycosyltransferase family 4 protein [Denitromonas iodatirespirans]MBT0963458.1 glycosyltransferase family 4 protein [Denitromonas iodatirespirans]
MTVSPPFALFYDGDAYSTANKIMGRQSAGKALMSGIARTWPSATVRGLVRRPAAGETLATQLRADGFAGRIDCSALPDWRVAVDAGTLYYPAPPAKDIAAGRNLSGPSAFSLMGVTHTLASAGAMDLLAELILPPFQPWDALICTSRAAHALVGGLHDDMRAYWRESVGATRFVDIERPVIPLGVDVPAFVTGPGDRAAARAALGLRADEIVFLFAGRLAFHAKANPAPLYQALQKLAGEVPLVCIEAGVFAGDNIRQAYLAAQRELAPGVRFVWVDGEDADRYRQAWQGADVFVSLSDNIQETFGLTPVEAMAAGLPVVVSDWNGYQDTVRDGVDGFRVPTVLAPAGAGAQIVLRHALGVDSYDRYIGSASLATVVDPQALVHAFRRLAGDAGLRRRLGAAGRARAAAEFDWPLILHRYAELATHLGEIRGRAAHESARPWPQRADPFRRFAGFASETLGGAWPVSARPDAAARLPALLSLPLANFVFAPHTFPRETPSVLLDGLRRGRAHTVDTLLAQAGLANEAGIRALMWLWKFDLVDIRPEAVPTPAPSTESKP